MKIALAGTGQMGQAVARIADENDIEIAVTFDSNTPVPSTDAAPEELREVDVIIDFTLPSVAVSHIEKYCKWQVPAVIGTTGWYDELPRVEKWVNENEATVLYAQNFSLGVALMVRALRGTLGLLNQLDEYDAYVHEMHHTKKVDSPSGTALMLAEELLNGVDRKRKISAEAQHGQIAESTLHLSSTRAGKVFGEHTVGLDSAFDQVRIEHVAKGRDGFAAGALRAARWLIGRQGLFTLDNLLDDIDSYT